MDNLFTAQVRGLFSTAEQSSGAHLWLGERQTYFRMKYRFIFSVHAIIKLQNGALQGPIWNEDCK